MGTQIMHWFPALACVVAPSPGMPAKRRGGVRPLQMSLAMVQDPSQLRSKLCRLKD
jgi:hypothetical protein